jgi:hypothetical protein
MKIWDRQCDTCGKTDEAWDDMPVEAPCAATACLGTMRRALGGRPSGFSRQSGGQEAGDLSGYQFVGVGLLYKKKVGGDA